MRIPSSRHRASPRGTVLPMLALCLVALFAFVALAVDLGMLAVSRTQCQNAADAAALVGCRTLNNKPGVANSNLASAVAAARGAVTGNAHLGGQYLYDPDGGQFRVKSWTDVTNGGEASPPGGSWTAVRVTLAVTQPTYFMRVFGVRSMSTGAVATAVYRPRDVAFALDMTGSMAYASLFNMDGNSHNPDPLVPAFGHYAGIQGNLIAARNLTIGSNEAASRNNYTIATPAGPPIVRHFYYDPANAANPGQPAFPLSLSGGKPNLLPAFHCIPASKETPGDSANYGPPTYDFGAYNAFDATRTNGPTPAPASFRTMTGTNYVGDRWRRGDGSIDKTGTSWTGGDSARAAYHAADLLGYTAVPTGFAADWSDFRDPLWETYGYDLDVAKYRAQRFTGGPTEPDAYLASNMNLAEILVPAADRYVGYSMGPGYWGKTFYVWPPDPRFDPAADVTKPDPARPAFDTSGRAMCDWRRRFFLKTVVFRDRQRQKIGNTTTTVSDTNATSEGKFDPQADNNNRNGSGVDGVNELLFRASDGMTLAGASTTQSLPRRTTLTDYNFVPPQVTETWDTATGQKAENYRVNYAAVLKWVKTGPQTLPPNLRAGRVLYYSSIPDDVDASAGGEQQKLDKVFWKRYIDFVLGVSPYDASNSYLYGFADAASAGVGRSVFGGDMRAYKFSWESAGKYPYMRYTDSPNRPRLHFWFGPLSMLAFLNAEANWLPGTCPEAQCWQLKAGMTAVIDDVRNNHPNDYLGLVMFAAGHHNGIRVPMGQDYAALKNALFYPKSLLPAINAGDVTSELRPYDVNFTPVPADEIPNAAGSTDPNTGLAYAFNLLSPSALLPPEYTTTVNGQPVRGRRGAAKMVILETDGVPNTWRGTSPSGWPVATKGYDSYYPVSTFASGNVGNNAAAPKEQAYEVVRQIAKEMARDGQAGGADSGLSLPSAPAKVYTIAFGDQFDVALAPNATHRDAAKEFLARVSEYGNTGVKGATTIPDHQIITGPAEQRIRRLKDCMQRIFQSGASVTLIE